MKCKVCIADNRDRIEADIRAGIPWRTIAKRHRIDKMAASRHVPHMDAKEAAGPTEFEWNKSIEAVRQSLMRAANIRDIRGMASAADLLGNLLRLQHVGGGSEDQEGPGAGTRKLSDADCHSRRLELLRVTRVDWTDGELREHIAACEAILQARATELASESDEQTKGDNE